MTETIKHDAVYSYNSVAKIQIGESVVKALDFHPANHRCKKSSYYYLLCHRTRSTNKIEHRTQKKKKNKNKNKKKV